MSPDLSLWARKTQAFDLQHRLSASHQNCHGPFCRSERSFKGRILSFVSTYDVFGLEKKRAPPSPNCQFPSPNTTSFGIHPFEDRRAPVFCCFSKDENTCVLNVFNFVVFFFTTYHPTHKTYILPSLCLGRDTRAGPSARAPDLNVRWCPAQIYRIPNAQKVNHFDARRLTLILDAYLNPNDAH